MIVIGFGSCINFWCSLFPSKWWKKLFVCSMLLQKLGVFLRSNFNISFKNKVFRTKEDMSEACLMSFVFYPLDWHNWYVKKPRALFISYFSYIWWCAPLCLATHASPIRDSGRENKISVRPLLNLLSLLHYRRCRALFSRSFAVYGFLKTSTCPCIGKQCEVCDEQSMPVFGGNFHSSAKIYHTEHKSEK